MGYLLFTLEDFLLELEVFGFFVENFLQLQLHRVDLSEGKAARWSLLLFGRTFSAIQKIQYIEQFTNLNECPWQKVMVIGDT